MTVWKGKHKRKGPAEPLVVSKNEMVGCKEGENINERRNPISKQIERMILLNVVISR